MVWILIGILRTLAKNIGSEVYKNTLGNKDEKFCLPKSGVILGLSRLMTQRSALASRQTLTGLDQCRTHFRFRK